MKKKLIVLSGFVMGLAPVVALAESTALTGAYNACATGSTLTTIGGILCKLKELLSAIIPLVIILGVVYFVWGVVSYVIASDEEAKTTGRDRMIYGIIGLAVIVSVWGLVTILTNTFGLPTTGQKILFPTTPY